MLLLAYALSAFFVGSWPGLALFAAFLAVFLLGGGVQVRRVLLMASPVYVLVLLTLLLNSLVPSSSGLCFSEAGFARSCFFGSRIVLLTWALLLTGLTVSQIEFMEAFAWFMAPLKKLGLPVDDAAAALSIALRFVPLSLEELFRVRNAQCSRGAGFDEGRVFDRARAWSCVLLPLVMGMFRRADSLSLAMDARCYGAASKRTALFSEKIRPLDAFVLLAGVCACVLTAWCF